MPNVAGSHLGGFSGSRPAPSWGRSLPLPQAGPASQRWVRAVLRIPPPAAAPLGLIAPASLTQRRATVPGCPSIISAGGLSGPLPGSISRGPAAVRIYIGRG